MLKCSRCGEYYVPGYLDCRCRVAMHLPRKANTLQQSRSSKEPTAATPFAPDVPKKSTGKSVAGS